MGVCPFCKAKVEEGLLVHGGSCPHCLNVIPGEEAPTDPGEQARLQAQAAERAAAQQKKQRSTLGLVAVFGALAAAGGAWYFTRPEAAPPAVLPEIVINRDLSGHKDLPGASGIDVEGGAAAASGGAADASASGRAVAGRPAPRNPSGGNQPDAETPAPKQSGIPGILSPTAAPAPAGGASLGMDPGIRIAPKGGLDAVVLSDPAEIQAMIQAVLSTRANQAKTCYNQRLKQREDLAGTWMVSFKVTTAGKAANVVVNGQGVDDSELESCLQRQIQGWTFQKINRDQPVSFPFTFGT